MLTYNVLNEYVERLKKQDMPVMATTDNITNLTGDDIAKLRVGDVVVKQTGNMKHLYLVTYKEENVGICLTYADATYIETVSYDYNGTTREWTYNSTDATQVQPKLTAGDNVAITNGVISATDTTYTAGTGITITDGVIIANAGQLYEHNVELIDHRIDYLGNFHCIIISSKSDAYTKSEIETLFSTYYNSASKVKSGIGRYRVDAASQYNIEYAVYRNNNTWYFYDDVNDTSTQVSFGFTNLNDNIRPL